MTNEELNKALYDKCDKEFDAFIDEMNQAFQDKANSRYKLEHGDEFLSEYAYQYTIYGDILMALEDMELSDESARLCLTVPVLFIQSMMSGSVLNPDIWTVLEIVLK